MPPLLLQDDEAVALVVGLHASAHAGVVGLAVGKHCRDGHAERLTARGADHVAHSFDEITALLTS